jgi:2-succinyl-5-enolpyruvyl-6-hydroxy-3-cyclohexene-1-carboxylate synthase
MHDPRSDDHPGAGPGEVAASFCATLVDEWARLGVAEAVVSPGSRSTPLALALDAHPGLRLHVVHDERSAGYLALGVARATGRPALVACTSGTAAVHFHAAVVEADLAAVPMLVLTADRPPELHGVLAPQTIDQRRLYGSSVRWYCEPGPPEAGGAPWWRDLARDALSRATGSLPGPVHLDLAFREPLLGEGDVRPSPPDEPAGGGAGAPGRPAGVPWGLTDEEVAGLAPVLSARRGVVVAGERAALDVDEAEAVWRLADHLGWPVLADGPSGLRFPRRGLVSTGDLLLRHRPFAEAHVPEVVLRLGGLLTSKVTGQWLAASGATQVALDRFGRCPDPDRVLARSFSAVPADAARALTAAAPAAAPRGWREAWVEAEATARAAIDRTAGVGLAAPGEPAIAMDVAAMVPAGGNLVASSSMPVRDLEWFAAPRRDVRFLANRGANGIDGVTSTAVGVAVGSGRPTVLLTGDLAFLHDAGALTALGTRPVDLTVVVVDNDGGGIFSFLPQGARLAPDTFERLFGTPHGVDLVALARAHGLPVEEVSSRAGLRAALAGARARGGARVVVIRTDRAANVEEHRRFQAAVAAALG